MPKVVPSTASNRALARALEILSERIGAHLDCDQFEAMREAVARLRDAPDNPAPYRN